jgi:hypothetical protein
MNTIDARESEQQQLARLGTLDRRTIGDMHVDKFAGLTFREYREVAEFSKLVCQAKYGLPQYLRGNASDCLVVTTQALRWRLDPVWVMQNSYVTKEGGLINFDNFVFGAILMASGLVKGRQRYTFAGDGDARTCTITVVFKDEAEPYTYTTPPLRQVRKHSSLWKDDPEQQLSYFAVRSFARRYIPEILGGVYARDEFPDSTQEAIGAPNIAAAYEPPQAMPETPDSGAPAAEPAPPRFDRINADGEDSDGKAA